MAVTYTQTLTTDMVVLEIETLLDWRNAILRKALYPTVETPAVDPQAPSAILMWCRREAERGVIDRKAYEKLALVHEELCKVARQVQEGMSAGATLAVEQYDSFNIQIDNFITQVRRLHQDLSDSSGSVDPVTGLRTVAGMRADIKREQDRYDRKGTSYSLANIEIDKLAEIQSKYDRRTQEAIYAGTAQMIARTVRSFDDAYYMGKGEYLIVLKHVEFLDACAVMDRLRAEIEKTPVFLPGGEKLKITASFGVAEALQRESCDVVIGNAKTAMTEAKGLGGGRVVEYKETSALEQYARDLQR